MDRLTRTLSSVFTYAFLGIMAFLSIFPFIWMILGATNNSNDIITGKIGIGSALIDNIRAFAAAVDVPLVFWNSIKIALISTALTSSSPRSPATASKCSAPNIASGSITRSCSPSWCPLRP